MCVCVCVCVCRGTNASQAPRFVNCEFSSDLHHKKFRINLEKHIERFATLFFFVFKSYNEFIFRDVFFLAHSVYSWGHREKYFAKRFQCRNRESKNEVYLLKILFKKPHQAVNVLQIPKQSDQNPGQNISDKL